VDELRRLRELRGITQRELSRTTGVDPSTLSQIEMGRRCPSLHTLETLADALDCEVRDFLPHGYAPPGKGPGPRPVVAVS
jgi:transcriptional regulator with XRE-family HTH domain